MKELCILFYYIFIGCILFYKLLILQNKSKTIKDFIPFDNKANIKKENGKEIFNNKKDADNANKINNKVNIKKEIANN